MAKTDGPGIDGYKFPVAVLICQILFTILFGVLGKYDKQADPRNEYYATHPQRNELKNYYGMFMDIHVMIFFGFGLLMTFLKRYKYSAVGFALLVASLAGQWLLIIRGLVHSHGHHISVGVMDLLEADFAAAVVLISFGAVLGKASPIQLLVMVMIEVPIYVANSYIGYTLFKAADIGGSMFIHTFGAYFGVACAAVMHKKYQLDHPKEGSVYDSDIFAMIGSLFLWIFWPSFNGVLAEGDERHRAVINTYMSLVACVMMSFCFSALVCPDKKFSMTHIQNATLAGGVAVGALADLNIAPYGAMLVGSTAGILSVIGYQYIQPFLADKLRIHDTCGVHNLHGMPGVMAGIGSAIACSIAEWDNYGAGLFEIFPQRAPAENDTILNDRIWLMIQDGDIDYGDGRSAGAQAGYQMAALGVTLALAIASGAVAGLILIIPFWNQPTESEVYDDTPNWDVAPELATTDFTIVHKQPLQNEHDQFEHQQLLKRNVSGQQQQVNKDSKMSPHVELVDEQQQLISTKLTPTKLTPKQKQEFKYEV